MSRKEMEGSLVNESREEIDDPDNAAVPSQRGTSPSAPLASHDYLSLFFKEGYSGVLENITKYLNVKDMKAFSSISREALDAVRHSKCFSDRIEFRISEKTVRSGVLENCSFPWKRLFIDLFKFADGVLETITSLQFLESVWSLKIDLYQSDDMNYLWKILIRTKSLRDLSMSSVAFKYLLVKASSTPELKQLFLKLDRLELRFDGRDLKDYDESLVPKFNLKSFSAHIFSNENLNNAAMKMVEQSKDTLEELDLDYANWRVCGWSLIYCPKLRIVKLTEINVACAQEVEMFLRNQPPLEEITVETDSFSRLLRSSLLGKLSKLRKLHIQVLRAGPEEGEPMPEWVDWTVLETVNALEDLRIEMDSFLAGGAPAELEKILCWLPISKLKKLYILDQGSLAEACLGRNISRFQNLNELQIHGMLLLGDDGLQKIIRGCPKLAQLKLVDLLNVKDYGISGVVGGTKVGVSLDDLKDLVTLEIRLCESLTLDSLLSVLRFHSLRSLELSHDIPNWQVGTSEGIVVRILEQNPNLRHLQFMVEAEWESRVLWNELFRDRDLELKVKEIQPQIERLEISHNYYDDGAGDEHPDGHRQRDDGN